MENACDVWSDLKESFAQSDLLRISELMQEIYSSQQDSKSVTSFYSELKILWEEFEIYIHVPNCTCRVLCSCDFMRNARHNHTFLYAIRFLTGLNENFAMINSHILLMDPLRPMNKIFSVVLQHERQGNFAHASEDSVLINYVDSRKFKSNNFGKSYSQGSNSKNGVRVWTFCGRNNHTVETCWKQHGVPPHLQKNYNSTFANHIAKEDANHVENSPVCVDHKVCVPTITHEQYEKLMSLIQGSSLNKSSTNVHASKQVSSSMSVGLSTSDSQGTSFISSLTCHNFTLSSWIID